MKRIAETQADDPIANPAHLAFETIETGDIQRHHFIDGMSFAPANEQADFARAHADLYDYHDGVARLALKDGRLTLGSLACSGFAVAAAMDFAALRPMPAAPRSRLTPTHPEQV